MKWFLLGEINLFILAALLFKSCKKDGVPSNRTVITVTDSSLNGWVNQRNPNTTITFTPGISKPTLGKGSLEFHSPTGALANFRSTAHHNTLLSSITAFRYSTYIRSRVNNTDNIFVVLQIDKNDDGKIDDHFIFEPRWQTGRYVAGIAPDQGPTVLNTWQTWDMLKSIWWFGPPPLPNPEMGGAFVSFASYISQNPTAKIINQPLGGGTGGIRLNAGAPLNFPGYWGGNFKGNADAFTIGVNGHTTVYDFEYNVANAERANKGLRSSTSKTKANVPAELPATGFIHAFKLSDHNENSHA